MERIKEVFVAGDKNVGIFVIRLTYIKVKQGGLGINLLLSLRLRKTAKVRKEAPIWPQLSYFAYSSRLMK